MLIKQNLQTDFCYETFHTSCTQPVGQSPGGRACLIKIYVIQGKWRENIDDEYKFKNQNPSTVLLSHPTHVDHFHFSLSFNLKEHEGGWKWSCW